MQAACSYQLKGCTLHPPLNVVVGLHTLETSLTIFKDRVDGNKKIILQMKEEKSMIQQAFLLPVIGVTSTDP